MILNQSIELEQPDVAIIFADISNFDPILKKEHTRIVGHLDTLYRKFDECCVEFGVQKIETVGKTYMAASGITDCENLL